MVAVVLVWWTAIVVVLHRAVRVKISDNVVNVKISTAKTVILSTLVTIAPMAVACLVMDVAKHYAGIVMKLEVAPFAIVTLARKCFVGIAGKSSSVRPAI